MRRTVPNKEYTFISIGILVLLFTFWGCDFDMDSGRSQESESIFPQGELAPENNTGKVGVELLVPPGSEPGIEKGGE